MVRPSRPGDGFFVAGVVAIIPARYGSTRFPGKPLALLGGKPMIQWVYERTAQVEEVERVLVATDDPRIAEVVRAFGGEALLTRAEHPSGTDRIAEVAESIAADYIVNVQGDLPLLRPVMVSAALAPLRSAPEVSIGTLRCGLAPEEWDDPNVVKVVTDAAGFALYFSRAPVPFYRNGVRREGHKHIGLYVYRRDALLDLTRRPPSSLELAEGLEQLRALEAGYRIRVADSPCGTVEIDTPEDLARAEALL